MFDKFKVKVKDEVKEDEKQEVRIFRTKEEILTELKQKLRSPEGINVGKSYIHMDNNYNFQEYELDKNVNKVNEDQGKIVDNKIWGNKLSLEQVRLIIEDLANKIFEEETRIKDILEYLNN